MKRMHTPQPYRAGHHERASIAARIAHLVREMIKPLRLRRLAAEAERADEALADMMALIELAHGALPMLQRRRVLIEARRMLVERGLA